MDIFQFHVPEFVFVALNLVILVLVLKKLLWNKVGAVLDARQAAVEKSQEDARTIEEGLKDMEAWKEDFEEGISQLTSIQMQEARSRAGREYDRIVAEAEEKAKQIVTSAHAAATRDRDNLLNEGKAEIVSVALEMTSILLEANMDTVENERLIKAFLARKDIST